MTTISPAAIKPAVRKSIAIGQEDFIQSIADALQYISYYHPADYIRSLAVAYQREESPAAKDAIAQILILHDTGPREWQARIGKMPVVVEA